MERYGEILDFGSNNSFFQGKGSERQHEKAPSSKHGQSEKDLDKLPTSQPLEQSQEQEAQEIPPIQKKIDSKLLVDASKPNKTKPIEQKPLSSQGQRSLPAFFGNDSRPMTSNT